MAQLAQSPVPSEEIKVYIADLRSATTRTCGPSAHDLVHRRRIARIRRALGRG